MLIRGFLGVGVAVIAAAIVAFLQPGAPETLIRWVWIGIVVLAMLSVGQILVCVVLLVRFRRGRA